MKLKRTNLKSFHNYEAEIVTLVPRIQIENQYFTFWKMKETV